MLDLLCTCHTEKITNGDTFIYLFGIFYVRKGVVMLKMSK